MAALIALWLTAAPGPGLEPDSMSYLGAAESLVRHGTLRVPWNHWAAPDSTSPLSDFPPGFALAIALPRAAGVTPIAAARWVMALSLGLAVAVLAALAVATEGAAAATLAAGLVLATPAVVAVNTIVLSEPLFLAILALTLHQMVAAPERPWRYGALAGIAALVRYAGVSLIAAAGLWAFTRPGDWRARAGRALRAGLPGVLLQAAWVARTDLLGGDAPHTSFDFYGGLWGTIRRGLGTVSAWLVPTPAPGPVRSAVAAVLVAAIALVVWRAVRPPGRPPHPILGAIATIAACYVAVLLYAREMVGEGIEFDDRILAPLFTLGAVAVAVSVVISWRGWGRIGRLSVAASVAGWLVLAVRVDAAAVRSLREGGYGYEGDDWQRTDFAAWIRGASGGRRYQLFTNDPAAAYFLSGRPSRLLPTTLDPDSVRALADTMRRRHGALLGFESNFDPVAPPESLAARLGLKRAIRFDYGAAWVP